MSDCSYLIASGQQQSRAARRVSVRGRTVWVPAHLVGSGQSVTSLVMQLEPLLTATIGHPAVQWHVTIVCLCGLVDGELRLLRSEEGSEWRRFRWKEKRAGWEKQKTENRKTEKVIRNDKQYLETSEGQCSKALRSSVRDRHAVKL